MKIRKIKIQGTLPKIGVWLPTLLAMHAQTNLNQGLLQVPPPLSSPSHPLMLFIFLLHSTYNKQHVFKTG